MKRTVSTLEYVMYHGIYPIARRETNALANTIMKDALSIDAPSVEYPFVVKEEK